MKVRLFNRGNGWYESISNYKDREDKAYMNYHFANSSEPPYQDNGLGYSVVDLDIQEWRHGCYKGKVGMTVFKYQYIVEETNENNMMADDGTRYQTKLNDGVSDMFDGDIQPDDLPFY